MALQIVFEDKYGATHNESYVKIQELRHHKLSDGTWLAEIVMAFFSSEGATNKAHLDRTNYQFPFNPDDLTQTAYAQAYNYVKAQASLVDSARTDFENAKPEDSDEKEKILNSVLSYEIFKNSIDV